jgi:hypothetical protein
MEITNDNLVATFRASGLTQAAFCKEQNIALERLRYYLYRKNRETSSNKQATVKRVPKPAFISFDNPAAIACNSNQDLPNTVTIIRGKFTFKQVAALISNLE